MEKILEVFARIFDKLTWKSRIVTFVTVVLIVIWIDSQMGFTYHYFIDRKLDEITKINQILKDTSFDNETKNLLNRERLSIITKSRGFLNLLKEEKKTIALLFI